MAQGRGGKNGGPSPGLKRGDFFAGLWSTGVAIHNQVRLELKIWKCEETFGAFLRF
jgi:hypothetical protein